MFNVSGALFLFLCLYVTTVSLQKNRVCSDKNAEFKCERCRRTCSDFYMYPGRVCNHMCKLTCECKKGYYLNGTTCIEVEKCPAVQEMGIVCNETNLVYGCKCLNQCDETTPTQCVCSNPGHLGCQCDHGFWYHQQKKTCVRPHKCPYGKRKPGKSRLSFKNEEELQKKEFDMEDYVDDTWYATSKAWINGVVNYYFDKTSYDDLAETLFKDVLDYISSVSCLQFVQILNNTILPDLEDSESAWLNVTNPNKIRECLDYTTVKYSGEIRLELGYDCLSRRDMIRSVLRALGLPNEITHPQRDQYVRVQWSNIRPDKRHLFRINRDFYKDKNFEYDPRSVLHFHDRAFSKNGHATIVPLVPGLVIDPSNQLSQLDSMKLRVLFSQECNKRFVTNLLDTCKNVLKADMTNEKPETVTTEEPTTVTSDQTATDEPESSKTPISTTKKDDNNESADDGPVW